MASHSARAHVRVIHAPVARVVAARRNHENVPACPHGARRSARWRTRRTAPRRWRAAPPRPRASSIQRVCILLHALVEQLFRERGSQRGGEEKQQMLKYFSPLAPLAVNFTHSAAAPVAFPWLVCFSPKTKDTIMTLQASPRGLLCTSAQKHPPRERPSLPKPPRAGIEAQGCALGGAWWLARLDPCINSGSGARCPPRRSCCNHGRRLAACVPLSSAPPTTDCNGT